MDLIGIDGCKAGWVLARSDLGLQTLHFSIEPTLGDVLRAAGENTSIAIDVPIGLADDDARACDHAARRILGAPRSSSVFSAPCRGTLTATSYQDACRLNLDARGRGVTQQLFNILRKIREVDELMTPDLQDRLREAHPEVTFALLAGTGRGLPHPKKTPQGEADRLALLQTFFPVLDRATLAAERARLGPAKVARDDLVDAVACLVTAYRIASGQARVLPDGPPQRDARGLRMEIVA